MKTAFSVDAWVSTGDKIMELDASKGQSQKENGCYNCGCAEKIDEAKHVALEKDVKSKSKPFESYRRRTTVVVRRKTFLDVVCDALADCKHVGPNQRADLLLACRIREKKESVTVLLCGTSGCGKSTLSALLVYLFVARKTCGLSIIWDMENYCCTSTCFVFLYFLVFLIPKPFKYDVMRMLLPALHSFFQ